MIDEHGFYHLEKIQKPTEEKSGKSESKKKKKKTKSPKFKKGGWKDRLYHAIRKFKIPHCVIRFHFDKLRNLIVKGEDVIEFGASDAKKMLKSKSDYVLINAYCGQYVRIPMESYRKLCRIRCIQIHRKLIGTYDGIEEYDVYEDDKTICNINDLMEYIVEHRAGANGVYELACACCGYGYTEFDIQMVIEFRDGHVKTYRSDMNDFMKDFGLVPF